MLTMNVEMVGIHSNQARFIHSRFDGSDACYEIQSEIDTHFKQISLHKI